MVVGGTQPTLRKYLGALKDTTTVSLAKVNSDYKVKAFSWFLRVTLKIFMFGHSPCLLLSYHFPPTTGIGHCNCQGHEPR
jgi:hypothetical protein